MLHNLYKTHSSAKIPPPAGYIIHKIIAALIPIQSGPRTRARAHGVLAADNRFRGGKSFVGLALSSRAG